MNRIPVVAGSPVLGVESASAFDSTFDGFGFPHKELRLVC
jgi:hypothetical protein